jgi:hypothetical protein
MQARAWISDHSTNGRDAMIGGALYVNIKNQMQPALQQTMHRQQATCTQHLHSCSLTVLLLFTIAHIAVFVQSQLAAPQTR